jgi:hypothetical protein
MLRQERTGSARRAAAIVAAARVHPLGTVRGAGSQ